MWVGAPYRAHADGKELTSDGVPGELAIMTPLSATREEDIRSMRAWAEGRATRATDPEGGGPSPTPS